MQSNTIAFIGGGNMARSLIGGLIDDGCDPARLWVADPDPQRLQPLAEHFKLHTTDSNEDAARQANVIVLAVKPQVIKEVARALSPVVMEHQPLIISVAAGIRETSLRGWLGGNPAIVRAMPNTPALVRCGATGLLANPFVSEDQREQAESIMRAVGLTLWVQEEDQMDAVTAVSGSGPAYFFFVMEAMERAGEQLGLSKEAAHLLVLETAFGAAKIALESSDDIAELRARVTSPGGTTEEALRVLQEGGLEPLFQEAMEAAKERAAALAEHFGEN